MPVVQLDKRYLYSLLGSGFDEKSLKDHVAKLGFEIEEADEGSLSLEVTANRPDLLCALGLARALKNFMHKTKKFNYAIEDVEPALEIYVDPSVKRIRPYVAGVVAKGIKLADDSLADVITFTEKFCDTYGRSRRKVAIGMHDLDAIKPPVEYRCEKDVEYVPLGGTKKARLSEVLAASPKGIQYSGIIAKGGKKFFPVIEDSQGVASFVPILNSQRTRVTPSTTSIFVDITGTSEYAVNKAAEILGAMFMDLGAKVGRVAIKYGRRTVQTPEMKTSYMSVPLARAEREIGVPIGFDNVISLANKMGYEAALVGKMVRFSIPQYRVDVIDRQDLIEDIAIGYGYEYINPIAAPYTQSGGLEQQTLINRKATGIMVGMGFSEFTNSYLTNEETNFDKAGVKREESIVVLQNPKTAEISMMRTWLLPSLLRNLGASSHDSMPQDVFELDMVFCVQGSKPVESYHLGAASVGPKANFNDMKAVVEGLLLSMGTQYAVAEFRHDSFIEGRCAQIKMAGKHAGFFGELHPKVLRNFGIEEPAVAMEIDISAR